MKITIILLLAISFVIALVPHALYVVVKTISILYRFRCPYRPYGLTALALVVLWLVLAVYGNLWGRFKFEQKDVTLSFATLPEVFDGYRVVHVSDFHLGGWIGHEQRIQQIVDSINALHADAILFTGDLVSLSEEELTTFIPILSRLHARDGVFSVLGNHDYMPYTRSWSQRERDGHVRRLQQMEREQLGWTLLTNGNAIVRRGTDSIAVCGTENSSLGVHSVVVRGDMAKTVSGTDGCFRILLRHDPTMWRAEVLGKYDVPLTLSGHTHGGQMSVLGLFYVSTFIYKEHAGLYTENDQQLYVNIGLGATMPMRVGAVPEITLITLKKRQGR